MKKNILIIVIGLSCLVLAGCTFNSKSATTTTGEVLSGEEILTGIQSGEMLLDANGNAREEVSDEDNEDELILTDEEDEEDDNESASTSTTTSTSISSDVADLIEDRASKPKDENKLTEDDIDLIEKIIQAIENIGK